MKIEVKKVGEVLIPTMFRESISSVTKFIVADNRTIESYDKLFKEVKKDRAIVIKRGIDREKIDKLFNYLLKKGSEILDRDLFEKLSSRDGSSSRKKGYDYHISRKLSRILLICEEDSIKSFKKEESIENLYGFGGSDYYEDGREKYDSSTNSYLIPYKFYLEISNLLKSGVDVKCIGKTIYSGVNVLVPKSQETTEIFHRGLGMLSNTPSNILDMGTGSGVLSITAETIFPYAQIYLTDIIGEALATARYNIGKNYNGSFIYNPKECIDSLGNFNIYRSGDLFEKIYQKFDLIMFNAPWIVSKARNRNELALNDENQRCVTKFLEGSYTHLNDDGRVLLGYSNNSGDEAVDSLETIIADKKFTTIDRLSVRVQSYQSGRKWMKIYLYILKKEV
ncbi:MAG: hypothetical protein CSA15_03265 [Candidatus Delongbacteria bacterium]|nr:MAG: hypothetical protein CSA15_03265 [Candidatus Delongbacteria bacterium]